MCGIVALGMVCGAAVIADVQATFYVSPIGSDSNSGTSPKAPFQTLEKARQAVDAVNDDMTGDIHVYLRGGTYTLTNTLSFTTADSASNGYRIYYEAYGNEVPVINGGTLVTGWTQHDGRIYKATLNRSGKQRTLIVNGKRAYMAKSAGVTCTGSSVQTFDIVAGQADWAWVSGSEADGTTYSANDIGDLSNPTYVEITRNTTWNLNTVCVREINTDGGTRTFLLQQPQGAIAMNQGWDAGFIDSGTHVFHNAYELLDSPGEFYYDDAANTLYYYAGLEDMDSAQVYAPLLGELVDIQGTDLSNRVENLTFRGITFANTEAVLPEIDGAFGKSTVQAATWCIAYADDNWHNDQYRAYDTMRGAINVSSADSIHFEDNVLKHIGNEGICMINDVQNSSIVGNLITDIGGSGIQVGHPQHVYEQDGGMHELYSPAVEGVCRNTLVQNNLMVDMTRIYAGHAGITAYFVNGLEMLNNHIESVQYSGASVGWGWWDFNEENTDGNPTTTAGNNKFNNNRVFDSMQTLHDGGAYYTLGNQPNSQANGNYFKGDSLNYRTVIYPDEGTGWYTGSNMVFEVDPSVDIIRMSAWHDKHDNHFSEIYSTSGNYQLGGENCTVSNLYVYPDADWPQEALDIIDAAGLEDAYDHLWQVLERVPLSGVVRLEAEEAALSGGAEINTDHPGYSGSGFVDGYYRNAAASTVFTHHSGSDGLVMMEIRYCAGNDDCTTVDLYVNGTKAADLLLPSTGDWDSWGSVLQEITLIAGDNSIEFRAASSSTDCANLDYVDMAVDGSTGTVFSDRFEAEEATLSGDAGVNDNHLGYSGAGFVDGYVNTTNASTVFGVSTAFPGIYQIGIRYAAGFGDCTNLDLYVNESKSADLVLPTTGAWASWSAVTQAVSLVSGLNTLEIRADSSSINCANLDCIDVASADVYAGQVAPYLLVNGAAVSVAWNPGGGYDQVYGSTNLTDVFFLLQSNAFDGVYSESVSRPAAFYTIKSE